LLDFALCSGQPGLAEPMSSSSVDDVDKHVLRKYEIVSKLGKGAYAVVFKAIDKKTKEVVALKKIFDAFQNMTDAQRTFREISYLMALSANKQHPNIIRLVNFLKAENDKDIYLVFDFMETDLHAVIRANILELVHKQFIVFQSLRALQFCHNGGLLHRDLKPSNLLLNEECVLKVADFGLARCLKDIEGMDEPASVLTDYVATRWYRAPEILLGSTTYGKGVDVWALGCIIAEMFLAKPLLPGTSTVDQLKQIIELTGSPPGDADKIMKSKFASKMLEQFKAAPGSKEYRVEKLKAKLGGTCPLEAIDLVAEMLDIDPAKRPTVGQSLAHPWLQAFKEKRKEEEDISEVLEIDLDDDTKSEVHVYRDALYNKLRSYRKTEDKSKRRMFFFGRGSNSARG